MKPGCAGRRSARAGLRNSKRVAARVRSQCLALRFDFKAPLRAAEFSARGRARSLPLRVASKASCPTYAAALFRNSTNIRTVVTVDSGCDPHAPPYRICCAHPNCGDAARLNPPEETLYIEGETNNLRLVTFRAEWYDFRPPDESISASVYMAWIASRADGLRGEPGCFKSRPGRCKPPPGAPYGMRWDRAGPRY
jgi:hypothetical protein